MVLYGFSCLDICLWVVGCRKPNPRMKFCKEHGILYGTWILYGSNLGYELYYESHGFCMGF